MDANAIDLVTYELYNSLTFRHSKLPKLTALKKYFFGTGLMVNNTLAKPIPFTTVSYLKALESQVAIGNLKQYMMREVNSKVEIFGKVAQRTSVYEYSFAEIPPKKLPRGVNFIQFVKEGEAWLITSMVWNDETEEYRIPQELLD